MHNAQHNEYLLPVYYLSHHLNHTFLMHIQPCGYQFLKKRHLENPYKQRIHHLKKRTITPYR